MKSIAYAICAAGFAIGAAVAKNPSTEIGLYFLVCVAWLTLVLRDEK